MFGRGWTFGGADCAHARRKRRRQLQRVRREEALALGVGEVVDYRAFDIASYQRRFDVVFDTAGALSLSQCGAMLKRRGMSLHIVPTSAKLIGCLLPSRHHSVFGNPTPQCIAGIADALERGQLVPAIGRIVPLSEAISAVDVTWKERAKPMQPTKILREPIVVAFG